MARSNKNVYTTMGSSTHSADDRQTEDYYATHPSAVRLLLKLEKFQTNILEPMCGEGHIAKVLKQAGHRVRSSDIIDRGFGKVQDFLTLKTNRNDFDIISNPPYKNVDDYVYKCMSLMKTKGQKTALLLRILFLEGKSRRLIFERFPPVRVWVSSSRISCAKNGDFERYTSSAMAFAWFIWEYDYQGDTILKWFN